MIPESIYLMHLAETGILGFLGLVILLTQVLRRAWLNCHLQGEISFIMMMSFLGLLFNLASFDGFLWKTPFYLFWIFLALINARSAPVKEG
jgi:O-antigen ligase